MKRGQYILNNCYCRSYHIKGNTTSPCSLHTVCYLPNLSLSHIPVQKCGQASTMMATDVIGYEQLSTISHV